MIGVSRNGYNYYYMRNAQGDVIALYNCYGDINSRYVYDSWGKLLSVTNASGTPITDQTQIAHVNPIRYRGYYYDKETGLYYLQSRYYDPVTERFLSADVFLNATGQLNGHNTFAYCGNKPVSKADSSGYIPVETVFDLVSLSISTYTFATAPTWLNFGFFAWDVAATLIPYAPGAYVGNGIKAVNGLNKAVDFAQTADKAGDAVKVVRQSDNIADGVNVVKKAVHGNSLKSTKLTYGYVLKDEATKEILKFGETSKGASRYTNKFYTSTNSRMFIITSGTKCEMHYWQHNQIISFLDTYGTKPPLNKSLW